LKEKIESAIGFVCCCEKSLQFVCEKIQKKKKAVICFSEERRERRRSNLCFWEERRENTRFGSQFSPTRV